LLKNDLQSEEWTVPQADYMPEVRELGYDPQWVDRVPSDQRKYSGDFDDWAYPMNVLARFTNVYMKISWGFFSDSTASARRLSKILECQV